MPPPPRPLLAAGQLAGLWALAVAQPLFEVLRTGEELVLVSWTGLDVVLFSLALVLVPPALMLGLERLAERTRAGWGQRLHLAFLGLLGAVLVMYVVRTLAGAGDVVLALAGLGGAAATVIAYRRLAAARSLLSILAVAPLASLALFLLASPASRLVWPQAPARPAASAAATSVVLVVFDEFPSMSLMRPDGRLDASAYPNLAALARDATWFRNATTPYDFTRLSVPAILGGRPVARDLPPSLAAHPDNLFTLLARTHAVHALESVTRMCPAAACPNNAPGPFPARVTRVLPALARVSAATFLPRALERRLPATHPLGTGPLPSQAQRFARLNRAIVNERRPGLFYIHSFLPHGPWTHLPSGQAYPLTGCCSQDVFPGNPGEARTGFASFGPDRWTADKLLVGQARQRHLAQARFADRQLGGVLQSLRDSGTYDRALVVVTADHGIAFTAGRPARRLTAGNLAEVLGVPLFVKAPGQRRGAVSRAFVRTTDVAPTVTAVLGVRALAGAAGSSLIGRPAARPRSLGAYAVQDRRWRRFTPQAFERQRHRALAARAWLFGEGGPFGSLYAFGPHRSLHGRRPAELGLLPPAGLGARLDRPELLGRVDPAADTVPAHISGVLGRGAVAGAELALELNGRVVATTRSYRSVTGAIRFSALLPVAALRPGRNRVRVHAIVPGLRPGRGLRLRPLSLPFA